MRNLTKQLSLSLLALVPMVGCAATTPGIPDDDDSTDVPPGDDPDAPVPVTATGKFAMTSEFDLATNMPGTSGQVVNIFIAATDDADDPTHYIVEQLVNALPDGSVKDRIRDSIPFVAGYLNDRLLQWAPDLVTKVVAIGDGFGQIAHHFGTTGVLEINASGQATHAVTGFHFKVDQTELDFPFEDYGLSPVTASSVPVTLSQSGKLTIGDHKVAISYGAALRMGLDEVVIPMIDPSAANLGEVLHNAIDCQSVGQKVYDAVGFGSPSTFESACDHGLTATSAVVYRQIDGLDGAAMELGINGVARGVDKNRDGAMDEIQTGSWTGNINYAGTPAELPMGAKFRATKM